jgi:hypothetical protein
MIPKENFKKRIIIFGLILLAGILSWSINSFSNPIIMFLVPGTLLGLALTIPHFDNSRKQIIAITTVPLVMTLILLFSLGIGTLFSFLNNSYFDPSGVIKVGLISSLFFTFILDLYYPIRNKATAYTVLIILGISSGLISDYLFLSSHSKEINLGKMIFIWELLIGFGLTTFVRFNWMTQWK